ncbi:hypothetical protein [Paracoccus sp. (in: a-proteobacteria)]|uniref:hypothetical protein n=1 Tax=Paracoccus sp. TaxID=267 RepID=UPI0035B1B40C
MSGGDDRPGVAPIWGITFALMLGMFLLVIVAAVWIAASVIDWNAVLHFIAPTAFETRPIEEILAGGQT